MILITGGEGQLGKEFAEILPFQHEDFVSLSKSKLDITNLDAVKKIVSELEPTVVINCAAWTNVELAETEPQGAYKINAEGPKNLAIACQQHNIQLIHFSTDFVFDGTEREFLTEESKTNPLNMYGKSKLEGEEAIINNCKLHKIIRTSWLFGQQGPNFVLTMLGLAKAHDQIRVVSDQCGSPTWTRHLALAALEIMDLHEYGIFHISNSGVTSWADFAREIFRLSSTDIIVEDILAKDYASKVNRPSYSPLAHRRWLTLGSPELPTWQEAVSSYLQYLNHK